MAQAIQSRTPRKRGVYAGIAGYISAVEAGKRLGAARTYPPRLADAGAIRSVVVVSRRLFHEGDVEAVRDRLERGEDVG